jgi:hypothetical protein
LNSILENVSHLKATTLLHFLDGARKSTVFYAENEDDAFVDGRIKIASVWMKKHPLNLQSVKKPPYARSKQVHNRIIS